MIFERLLASLSGGGAFGAAIDYKATLAKDSIVPEDFENSYKVATFAAGCFWGLELAYQRVPGVAYTAVGYSQGRETYPNYDMVCAGATGHTESVIVLYDPKECSFESLLDVFFDRVDPLIPNGQGNDRGKQYRTGVCYHSPVVGSPDISTGATKVYKTKNCNRMRPQQALFEGYHQQFLEEGGRTNSPQRAERDPQIPFVVMDRCSK
eukprot:scaffold23479_cov143-Cylindrotheca_fusiformis.AAC.24